MVEDWLVGLLEQDPPLRLVIGLIESQGDRLIGRMVDGNSIFKFVGHRRASGVYIDSWRGSWDSVEGTQW